MKPEQKLNEDRMVRILAKDIEGNQGIYSGLTKIKGISWGMANAICRKLKIDKKRKIGSLNPDEIKNITKFAENPSMPSYLKNRRKDFETGNDKHIVGGALELQKEFDIKRLKKIKNYRGVRHSSNLPLRGQRTKSNFRRNRARSVGIKKKGKKDEKKA